MAYTGKKPSFEQVRVDELVVRQGSSVSVAAGSTTVDLDVNGVSFISIEITGTSTDETVIGGIVAPVSPNPAMNGKIVVLKNNSNTQYLVFKQESGTALAPYRLITGISAELRLSPKGMVSLSYDENAERWNVLSSSSEVISSLIVGTNLVALSGISLDLSAQPKKSTIIELDNGGSSNLSGISVGETGQLLILANKTGGILQITNDDPLITNTNERILTGTGAPVTIKEDSSIMLSYSDDKWNIVGGTGSGGGATEQVPQTGIGVALDYPIGTPLYVDATGWHKANAAAVNTAEVAGLISRHLNSDLAEVSLSGEVAEVTADAFIEAVLPQRGDVVFLSTTDGKLSVSDVTTIGYVSKPIGIVHNVNGTSSVDVMFYNQRGVVAGGVNARTQIALAGSATVPTSTIIQDVSEYEAGEFSGWVYINATTDYKFYFQSQFAENGLENDYNIAVPQTVGDTPPVGFAIDVTSAGVVSVDLPALPGFVNAYVNFALNAPAVGAAFPLSINSNRVYASYKMITGVYTAEPSDDLIVATGSSAYAVTLPTAVGSTGKKYTIKSYLDVSVALTVDTTGGEFIDEVSSRVLQKGEGISVISDGSKWVDVSIPAVASLDLESTDMRFNDIIPKDSSGISVKNAADTVTNVFVSDTGSVGIGTSTFLGDEILRVNHSGSVIYGIVVGDEADPASETGIYLRTNGDAKIHAAGLGDLVFGTSVSERLRIRNTDGSLLVGAVPRSDYAGLFVNGVVDAYRAQATSGGGVIVAASNYYGTYTSIFQVRSEGQVYARFTSIGSLSDMRFKTNVQRMSGSGCLAKVLQLQPSSWEWSGANKGEAAGFVAQEMELVFPQFVTEQEGAEDGVQNPKSVAASGNEMSAILVAAIQELNAKIEAQQARIDQLEADVAALQGTP